METRWVQRFENYKQALSNLSETIEKIVNDNKLMKNMGEKAYSKSVHNVQEKIYKEIKKVTKGDNKC